MFVAVATCASCWGILERSRFVTLLARDNRMLPQKRETREIVIVGHLLTPGVLIVALPAIGAQLPFVGIVLLVAGDACRRKLVAI